MIKKAGSLVALILTLALTVQSALAVDHVHLNLADIDSCLVCSTSSPGDALLSERLEGFDFGPHIQFAADPVSSHAVAAITLSARGPPVRR